MDIQNKDITTLIKDIDNLRWRVRNHYASFMIGNNDDLGVKIMDFAKEYSSLLDEKNDCIARYLRLNNRTMTCEFYALGESQRINEDPFRTYCLR